VLMVFPEGSKRYPKWVRTVVVADDNSEVYLSAPSVKAEEKVLAMCAFYDNVPVVQWGNHLYFPASWLEREYPLYRANVAYVRRQILPEVTQ